MSASSLAIRELDSQERQDLSEGYPELAAHDAAMLVAADNAELLAQAAAWLADLAQRRQRMDRIIEAMLPSEVPNRTTILQARRNAEAREELLREFGALTSTEVAELAGSKATNRAALANRWRKERRVFAVHYHGQLYFPTFQFDVGGRPKKVVGAVLESFGERSLGWQTALWFTSANGFLDGERPVDLLEEAPAEVAEAARREAEELVF